MVPNFGMRKGRASGHAVNGATNHVLKNGVKTANPENGET
jgi:hypothetical protein